MIKKLKILLFAFLFVLFGFSFSGAYKIQPIGIISAPSVVNNQYDVTFLKGGGLLSNFLGASKGILALDSNILFWWTPNGFPYVYSPKFQGFYDRYFSCDPFTGLDSTLNGCSSLPLNYTGSNSNEIDVFKNFFSKVVPGDYVYYNYVDYRYVGATYDYYTYYLDICFSSSEIGKSLCFLGGRCSSDRRECKGGMTNSQNYSDLNFGNIPYNSIGYAPGQNGYGGQFNGSTDGSTQGTINNQITGDYVYGDCTYNDVIIALESEGYNNYVCYGGLDNFSLYDSSINYSPIPGSGLSIAQIWGHSSASAWDNFVDWFIFWNGLYKDDSNNYTAMWESYPAVYHTYFQLYNQYRGSTLDPRTLLEYCQLKSATFDKNLSVGGYFKPACETIIREKQTGLRQCRVDGTIYSGCDLNSTGNVPLGVNWGGVGNMSGLEIQSDGLNFIQNYFNILKAKLSTNYSDGFVGIIPGYILIFLFAIILFKFLSK